MKKISIVFVILILISLLTTSVVFAQENDETEEESDFKWVFKVNSGLNISLQQFYIFADGPDPENPEISNELYPGDSEGLFSISLYSLFGDGHAIGFLMQFSPLYDFHYHLAYYKEFYFIDFIVPSVMATMGFNFVNGYPGFGFKGGGAITIIPNVENVQFGFQLLLSWGYGRRMGSDAYEGRYLFQMPFSLFIKVLF
jgi:hypothetical protein